MSYAIYSLQFQTLYRDSLCLVHWCIICNPSKLHLIVHHNRSQNILTQIGEIRILSKKMRITHHITWHSDFLLTQIGQKWFWEKGEYYSPQNMMFWLVHHPDWSMMILHKKISTIYTRIWHYDFLLSVWPMMNILHDKLDPTILKSQLRNRFYFLLKWSSDLSDISNLS